MQRRLSFLNNAADADQESFFATYQAEGELNKIKQTVHKKLNRWLKGGNTTQKISLLNQLLAEDVAVILKTKESEEIPAYIRDMLLNAHDAIPSLKATASQDMIIAAVRQEIIDTMNAMVNRNTPSPHNTASASAKHSGGYSPRFP